MKKRRDSSSRGNGTPRPEAYMCVLSTSIFAPERPSFSPLRIMDIRAGRLRVDEWMDGETYSSAVQQSGVGLSNRFWPLTSAKCRDDVTLDISLLALISLVLTCTLAYIGYGSTCWILARSAGDGCFLVGSPTRVCKRKGDCAKLRPVSLQATQRAKLRG
jgi:hypothetical protein